MKLIVISGINIFEGGALSVYKDSLDSIIESKLNQTNNIIAFVYKKELFREYEQELQLIELPKSRKSYFYRLWYEYVFFYFYSKLKNIDIWISLHDITPNVIAKRRYVYCHNPAPFMKTQLKNLKYSFKNFLFSLFYKYLYKINIKKNTAVIVQQDWIREEFYKSYKLKNIIVARPVMKSETSPRDISSMPQRPPNEAKGSYKFIVPSYPRFFKNFEVVCAAAKALEKSGCNDFKIVLTIDGSENAYSKDIVKAYGSLENVEFIGIQSRESLLKLYEETDCLIFPSKLETWGLPITEFKATAKPVILAKLPYAFETIGSYDRCTFFNPDSSKELAEIMKAIINGSYQFQRRIAKEISEPFANNWEELIKMILDND